jgi:hypothetical protein
VLFEEVDEHLTIRRGLENVSFCFQLAAERNEIVNLTVEDNPDRLVLVAHRLEARLAQVDDGESSVTECRWRAQLLGTEGLDAEAVRAAVPQGVRHVLDHTCRILAANTFPNQTRDPAHCAQTAACCCSSCSVMSPMTRTASRPSSMLTGDRVPR